MKKSQVESSIKTKKDSEKRINAVTGADGPKKLKKNKNLQKKDKIEAEENVEVVAEQKELIDVINVQNYNEQNNNLINKIIRYIYLRKKENLKKTLKKYYKKEEEEPLFYIDMDIPKCVLDTFLSTKENNSNSPHQDTSIYFYNVINTKCLNIIFHFVKTFLKLNRVDCFPNCCEVISLSYVLFFILLTDFYFLNKSIKWFCIENLKLLFKIKKYIFEKYIRCIIKALLKRNVLLKEARDFSKKNNFFSFSAKMIKGADIILTDALRKIPESTKTSLNEKQAEPIYCENVKIHIYCSKKTQNTYFINVLVKNNSYEYINDIIFYDLFHIDIFTNRCSENLIEKEEQKIILFDTTNEFNKEKKYNSFTFVFIVELPETIYKKQDLEVVCIETETNSVKYLQPFQPAPWKTEKQVNTKVNHKRNKNIIQKKKQTQKQGQPPEKEGEVIKDDDTASDTEQNSNNEVDFSDKEQIENNANGGDSGCSNDSVHELAMHAITVTNKKNGSDTGGENDREEIIKEAITDDITFVKMKSEQYTMNEKAYLKIYSNATGHFCINLNNLNNFPYIEWKIRYENDSVFVNLKTQIEEFLFEINHQGIRLISNQQVVESLKILKDIYNTHFGIYMLLFLLKTKGINLLITNKEIKEMEKKKIRTKDERIGKNVMRDLLLCFRIFNFSSVSTELSNSTILIRLVGNAPILNTIFKDSIEVEYQTQYCKIKQIVKENGKTEQRFLPLLSKHTSVLFCLHELCEYHKSSLELNQKTQIAEEEQKKESEKEREKEIEKGKEKKKENEKAKGKRKEKEKEKEKEKRKEKRKGNETEKEKEKEKEQEKENDNEEDDERKKEHERERERKKTEYDDRIYGIDLRKFLSNIFASNKIEQINELIKKGDTLEKSLTENDKTNVAETELTEQKTSISNEMMETYNQFFEINEVVYNLYFFLKLTKIISLTNL